MTPEVFTQKLQETLGDQLVSVVLYGSAAIGDRTAEYSDFNVLVVCQRLSVEELKLLSPLTVEWANEGNPPPLLFTWERLLESSDVFPIELLDIKENHLTLYGEDVLKRLPISQGNLLFQLEHEVKGKLIQLREGYLLTGGEDKDVIDLLVHSLSPFQVLMRAALRFYEVRVPHRKMEAVRTLAKHVSFSLEAFEELNRLKNGETDLATLDVTDLFQRFLETIERAADLISRLGRSHD